MPYITEPVRDWEEQYKLLRRCKGMLKQIHPGDIYKATGIILTDGEKERLKKIKKKRINF